jgi:hypothetical protein
MAAASWVRRRAARRRVAAALAAAPTAPAAWRDGEPAVIAGVLHAERPVVSVAVLGYGRGKEQVEHGRGAAPEAWLDVDGERVELAGSVAIVVGSRVVRHHAVPPEQFEIATVARDKARRAGQLDVWHGGVDGYHVRYVKDGDVVLARGTLVRGDGGWRLDDAIELAARGGVVDPVVAPPMRTLAHAAIAGLAVWVGLAALL